MNPAVVVFPAFMVASGVMLRVVALVSSPRGIARTARDEAETATARALLEHRVQHGRDEADRVPDALACAQACAAILHSHLLHDHAEYAATEWASYLGTLLGPTPILDPDDRMWLGLRFDTDAPTVTIAACLAASAGRARYEAYEAGDQPTAQNLSTVIELFDDKLVPLIHGGHLVRDLVQADRRTFAALEHKLAEPGSLLWAVTEWAAK